MVMVEELFQWSWSVGIVNIFCTFYESIDSVTSPSFNVFRFDPFGTFHLINLTGSDFLQNYFPSKMPNYRRHPIGIALMSYLGLDAFDLQFWIEIKKALNASYTTIGLSRKDVQSKRLYETGEESPFDFFMHESHHIRIEGTKVRCYPHKMGTIVLLVPHAKQRSGIMGYIQNATWKVIFILTSIAIIAASLLLTINAFLKTKKVFLLQKVVDVVNLLMNDNDTINYAQLSCAELLVIVPLTFVGLIVMNGVLSVFQSYLTLPLYERQINSLEDLYESSVPIIEDTSLFWSSQTKEMLELVSQHGGWQDKMIRKSFQDEADYFNDSVAFFVYGNQAQIYLEAQKQLGLKAYHLVTGLTFDTFYSIYQISSRFPFIDRVNDVVHRLQSAGLIEKWYKAEDDESIDELRELNRFFKTADKETDNNELILLWIGWIGSGIVFVCEIIWNKVQTRVENLKKKLIVQVQRILRK
ncbi:uncharacterized protein LOC119078153 [Bradysia coprophila]|uniref:uncharacterized protein LOC119078153 n=1 Tax=Bradysia coprophila TaxID=38358 RepID=UPI00187DA968|nr:uncharacterized protein LOC119078153 [Bradysia coprophila]